MERVTRNLEFENAHIMFTNFRGLPTKFDPAGGKRTFCVAIPDPDLAQQMRDEGWNVRVLAPRNEDELPLDYMQVKVAFGNIPPKVIMIANGVQTPLDETDIGQLDTAEIQNVDLVIRPYNWSVRGDTGVTAYLKAMYVTIEMDRFAIKYEQREAPRRRQPEKDDDELPF